MLNYRRYGNGNPLIMQHGFMGGSANWIPLLGSFGASFDVIAPDLPGFAGSAGEPLQDSIEGLSATIIDLANALGLESFCFLGHSLGSMIGLQLALDDADRLQKLVLYGSASTGNLPDRFESFDETIARFDSGGVQALADRIVRTWFVAEDAHPYYLSCYGTGLGLKPEAARKVLTSMNTWDVTDRIGEIEVPSLIICGDRDRSTAPDHSIALRAGMKNSELCIVPGCAHNVHLEKPELFSHVVRDFLLSTN